MPVSASYRGSLAPCSDSNQVQGACPLWGLKIRANEGRGQTCLDYAKCSRIWRNSKNHHSMIFSGDKTMRNLRSRFSAGYRGSLYLSMPSCRAGTYFFEIKKVCKKILPQGSGFLGNAKRKLNHVNFFNFRFGRLCCTKTLTRCAQTHEF